MFYLIHYIQFYKLHHVIPKVLLPFPLMLHLLLNSSWENGWNKINVELINPRNCDFFPYLLHRTSDQTENIR